MRSTLTLLVFTAIVAIACAQANRQTSIFTDSACATQIGVLIESGVSSFAVSDLHSYHYEAKKWL
jgi:hypothetical protein